MAKPPFDPSGNGKPDSRVHAPQINVVANKGERVGVFVLDTSTMVQLGFAKNRQKLADMRGEPRPGGSTDPMLVPQALLARGNTLVITHSALQELLQFKDMKSNSAHCFGMWERKGKLGMSFDTNQTSYPSNRQFFQFLRKHRDDIRFYASPQSMLDAGEFDHAKGGIVIVANQELEGRALNGSGKYSVPTFTPPIVDGDLPNIPHKNVGDASVHALMNEIAEYYQPVGGKGYAFLAQDNHFFRDVNSFGLSHPEVRTPKAFSLPVVITGLVRQGELDEKHHQPLYELLMRKNERIQSSDDLNPLRLSDFIKFLSVTHSAKGGQSRA